MIIKLIIDLIYSAFSVLTSPMNIPGMPDQVIEFLAQAIDYIGVGINLLSHFVDIKYLLVLFGVVILVDSGFFIYKVVMWVLRKIPMVGIS